MKQTSIIYIVGPPGVGKYSLGRFLERRANYELVDNHRWLNPILSLVEEDGVSPLPPEVFILAEVVRNAIFSGIKNLSPEDRSYVVTNSTVNEAYAAKVFNDTREVATHLGALLLVVRLACQDPDELARRVSAPERRALLKSANVLEARKNALLPLPDLGHPYTITIETSKLSTLEVAQRLVGALKDFPELNGVRWPELAGTQFYS